MLARARQVAPQSYATLASTAGTRLAALLSLRYRYVWCSLRACQLVFSSKRSLSRHPRLLLPPNPSRFRYHSILLHWVQPPLIVRLACGSRGRRAVIVFACYVSFLLLPPLFHRCGSIAPLTATYLQPKGELAFHSLHYVPLIPLRSIKLHYIHSFRQALPRPRKRKLHSTQKTPPALLGQSSHSFRLRYIPCSLPAALAPLATASPYTSAAGKALRYRSAAFPPPRCSRLFSLALGKEV